MLAEIIGERVLIEAAAEFQDRDALSLALGLRKTVEFCDFVRIERARIKRLRVSRLRIAGDPRAVADDNRHVVQAYDAHHIFGKAFRHAHVLVRAAEIDVEPHVPVFLQMDLEGLFDRRDRADDPHVAFSEIDSGDRQALLARPGSDRVGGVLGSAVLFFERLSRQADGAFSRDEFVERGKAIFRLALELNGELDVVACIAGAEQLMVMTRD